MIWANNDVSLELNIDYFPESWRHNIALSS